MRMLAPPGPLFTLLAVLAVGVGLFVVNDAITGGSPAPLPAAAARDVAPSQEAATPPASGDKHGDYGDESQTGAAPTDQAAPRAGGAARVPAEPEAGAAGPPAIGIAYAGRSAGNEVTTALGLERSSEHGNVVAYVCDGKKIESWLEGSLTGTSLRLTGPDGAQLTAEVSPTAVLGSVAVAGKSWPFSAQPARVAGAATDRAVLRALGRV